jgi:hypothetical protein
MLAGKKGGAMKSWLWVLLLVAITSCDQLGQSDIKELARIEQRWSDGVDVASATGRIALSPQVANLQSVRRDLEALEVSACLKPAKVSYVNHMNYVISSFLRFMREDKAGSESDMANARIEIGNYRKILTECRGGKT